MASEEHINLLRQGFKVWNLWRQRHPKIVPELKGADLTGLKLFKVDLSGADLSEVDFSGTSLYQANLSGTNLYRANLSTAILQEADFSGASLIETNLKGNKFPQTNLSGANLSGANLSGAKFYVSTNLNKTDFSLSNLSGADLSGLDLRGSIFTRANLHSTNLNATNLGGVNLCKANLSQANLSQANLEYANLRRAQIQETTIDEKWHFVWDIVTNGVKGLELQGLDLSMADLEGANLCEAELSNVNLTGTKLSRANLTKSNLFKANLIKTDLTMADLRMANLSEANLNDANLKYAKFHRTQIQEAIIDEKWYLVWDIVNNGAEGRDISEADLSEADLSKANFKNGNLSRADFSRSILNGANFSWTDLSRANFRKANLAGAHFDWADLSEADLSEVEGFGSITCNGASFSGTSFRQTSISSGSLSEFRQQGANFREADLSEANIQICAGGIAPIRDKKEFFGNLLFWKNKEAFNESINKSLSSSKVSFIPGVLLYTDEDDKLFLYIREHFDALDKLTGDWCTIYLLENPSPKWRQANHNWRKMIKSSLNASWLNASWFKSKPYDKSEAYDIARQLNVESRNLPCLVLISPANLSEKLVLPIREVSPEYFRKLFSTLEKLVTNVSSKGLKQRKTSSQVFDHIKVNFNEIVDFLEKNASKEDNSTKYTLEGDNIFVSIEPVNISNVNYNEKIEGNYVQGDYTDQSHNLKVGDVGRDFKPIGSALMADGFRASGTVAESINIDQSMPEGAELQNQQDEKSASKTSKAYESRSIGEAVGVIVIVLALLSGVAVYIFFQLASSKQPVPHPSQEQRIKE